MAPEPACVVLVVDDDPGVRRFLQCLLDIKGVTVIAADCGEEALPLLRQHGLELAAALVDVRLPGMDGPATIRAMLALDPGLPCRLMTGDSRGELDGVSPWRVLKKPFDTGEVLAAVREMRRGDWPEQGTL